VELLAMIVLRCEDKNGVGPYRAKTLQELTDRFPWVYSHSDETHPPPWKDGIDEKYHQEMYDLPNEIDHPKWQCGFASLDQMYNWFNEDQRIDLIAKGYRFLWFQPRGKVLLGKHQCVFHRISAKILGPISEVLP
jgi:hypothetical protein